MNLEVAALAPPTGGGRRELQAGAGAEGNATALNPAVLMARGLVERAELARGLREAIGASIGVFADAVFVSYTLPVATAGLRTYLPEDAINTFGNRFNTTDAIIDFVMGGAPKDPTNRDGLSTIPGGRRLEEAQARAHARRLELSLLPSPPAVPAPNATSMQLRMGFSCLTPSLLTAQQARELLLSDIQSDTSRLSLSLGAALAVLRTTLNLTATFSIPAASIRAVTLPYTRSWLYYLLEFLRRNIQTIVIACSALMVILVGFGVWRAYRPPRKGKWGMPKKKVSRLVLAGAQRSESKGGEAGEESEAARSRKRHLAAVEAKLLNPEPTADELEFSPAPSDVPQTRGARAAGGGGSSGRADSFADGSAFGLDSLPGSVHDTMDDLLASHRSVSTDGAAMGALSQSRPGTSGSVGAGAGGGSVATSASGAPPSVQRRGFGRKPTALKGLTTVLRTNVDLGLEKTEEELEAEARHTEKMARELLARPSGKAARPLAGGGRAVLLGAGARAAAAGQEKPAVLLPLGPGKGGEPGAPAGME